MTKNKRLVLEYLKAISGKPKPQTVLDQYIADPDLKAHILFFESAFPEYELIAEELLEEGNKVAIRGTVRGVHGGEMMGIAPSGKQISVSLMLIHEIEKSKILNHWMIADNFALMQQLGVIQ
ncbi:ester cyclase [candidate division KSB1 bacterium]|nr:ester cyclase [candidate division KSB1 bacterium]